VKGLREWTQVPIIVLSARGHEKDKVDALDAGADDYLTKPFAVGELLARIRVAVRRSGREKVAEPIFEHGDLRVDFASRQVTRGAAQVHLTPNEYRLLTVLVRHAGQVVTHKQLLSEVWGAEYAEESHYLRVYMGQLRHKLEADPARPQMLINEPGVGYRFRVE
jgi:two-component system, OmpR family, KDP operon response regulator KdpE